ncbi:hypothetical protein HJA76_01340 [Rhizobium bangladeshense]|uniref:Eco57I restriction-modification methylase domain-containing protein n=1 Tax=Rhizobium bangladeshense TaxID=1138189 RepID=UPI001C83904C|nr:hypothetical protein [Rhizobium bangladeshense]MBX4918374.1 hypothetical protein [Rhizobium bangladeshense]
MPLLTVTLHAGRAWLCGPSGEDLPIYADKDAAAIERLCAAALKQPDRHAALLFLGGALPSLETSAPGLRNEGLFALHELITDAPQHPEWGTHVQRARTILRDGAEGHDLLRRLGYAVERLDNLTHLLKGYDRRLALAVLLDRSEIPEDSSQKFGNLSPVSYALTKADRENLNWVMVLQGDRLRLYPSRQGVGVGRRGRTETYVEVQTTLLADEQLAFLSMLFSAEALLPEGSVKRLLDKSERFADDLAKRLRDRIYVDVMPLLAQGVAEARNLRKPTAEELDLTYRMALTVLFRLLFVAYAEDKDLLPYAHSEAYKMRSLKHKARELAEHFHAARPVAPGTSHWDEVSRIWRAVSVGDAELSVPPYNGGLFTMDPAVSPAGAELAKIALPNEIFEPALKALLLSDVERNLQPVDFRSLGVREFGTIYEGLLESELSVADQDLIVDKKGSYVPLRGKQDPVVRKGEIYLHDRSGARKASGSYFTKSFAVEHLLDRALVPALDDHLRRVAAMDAAAAADAFFDFRVADIAMGSGHFLVAAVDRIEKAFTDYLAVPGTAGAEGVRKQLEELKTAARKQLGELAEQMTFEDSQLLRRLIARRCIYGVDLNPLSVELARLAIWIHTFVPGLPLSVLDHNLVNGNALVGVGTVAEIREVFEASSMALFPVDADNLLGRAAQPLRRLANISDATMSDIAKAREAITEAEAAVADTKALCDIIAAQRMDPSIRYQFENWELDRNKIQRHPARSAALAALLKLRALHFPIAFPEVFLRERGGFDVLIGNPPWKKSRVEEHEFWARHSPGLRSMKVNEKNAHQAQLRRDRPDLLAIWEAERDSSELVRNAVRHIPGMSTGHPDLFRAFLWRFTQLASPAAGRVAVVLPGETFKIKGTADLRRQMTERFSSVETSFLTNKGEWVFDGIHEQKFIVLVNATAGVSDDVAFWVTPECRSRTSWEKKREAWVELPMEWLARFSSSLILPTISDVRDKDILDTFLGSPALCVHPDLRVRRVYADFETTRDKELWQPWGEGRWPVYGGEGFDLWESDRGAEKYYAWTDPTILSRLVERRERSPKSSPYGEMASAWKANPDTHPALHPRIAFRNVTNRTNQRTLLTALIPPRTVTVEVAPWILFLDPGHDLSDEAFLLGAMSSRICDWWVRRFAEGHVDEEAFNCIRIPRRVPGTPVNDRLVALAGRLAAQDERFAGWAKKIGVEWGPVVPQEKQSMIDELDAVVARLYGLSEDQLRHIFETFHEGWAWEERFGAVCAYFRHWTNNQ